VCDSPDPPDGAVRPERERERDRARERESRIRNSNSRTTIRQEDTAGEYGRCLSARGRCVLSARITACYRITILLLFLLSEGAVCAQGGQREYRFICSRMRVAEREGRKLVVSCVCARCPHAEAYLPSDYSTTAPTSYLYVVHARRVLDEAEVVSRHEAADRLEARAVVE
jgi:hypothetical protein